MTCNVSLQPSHAAALVACHTHFSTDMLTHTRNTHTHTHTHDLQRFITALTRGGPNGMPRPIEIHAHDSKRYINDMLAWVHQSLASEREFVVALFGDAQEVRL